MPISNNAGLLRVENLSAGYGKRQVLFEVSFEIKAGEIVLLVGGNGSGKSTLLKAIYGLLRDYQYGRGKVIFLGENITNSKPSHMIAKGLVYVPQKNSTFEHLSVDENLQLVASNVSGKEEKQRRIDGVLKKLPQLAIIRDRTPFRLSGGERQQVALAMALIQKPKMILLDEPNLGLAPSVWHKSWEVIRSLNGQGIAFLIVEHRVQEMSPSAHRVLQMKLGRIQRGTEEGAVQP